MRRMRRGLEEEEEEEEEQERLVLLIKERFCICVCVLSSLFACSLWQESLFWNKEKSPEMERWQCSTWEGPRTTEKERKERGIEVPGFVKEFNWIINWEQGMYVA